MKTERLDIKMECREVICRGIYAQPLHFPYWAPPVIVMFVKKYFRLSGRFLRGRKRFIGQGSTVSTPSTEETVILVYSDASPEFQELQNWSNLLSSLISISTTPYPCYRSHNIGGEVLLNFKRIHFLCLPPIATQCKYL